VRVPYLPTIILLVFGLVVLLLLVWNLLRSLRRFTHVKTSLTNHLTDRAGLLRARSAALRVATAERGFFAGRGSPRTISSSVEQEDHRA
jgi:hypothetical protein